MAFLATRNSNLIPRFSTIASWYARHGDAWRVRWDYAFFQMLIETNFLTYRQPNGRWGDVDPKQNNFAGLGTTGGGVPGDSYPDVSTGVWLRSSISLPIRVNSSTIRSARARG